MRVPAAEIRPGDLLKPDSPYESHPQLVISVERNALNQVDIITFTAGVIKKSWCNRDWRYEVLNVGAR